MAAMPLSLFKRILLWFVLNLLILAAIFTGYLNLRIYLPPGSPFAGALGERLQVLPFVIGRELSGAPRSSWEEMIKAQAGQLGVELYLISSAGKLVAGSKNQVPDKVLTLSQEHLQKHHRAMQRQPGMPPAPPPGQAGQRPPLPLPNVPGQRQSEALSFSTSGPKLYWAGVPVMVMSWGGGPPLHGMLLASSPSITGNGLFFDPMPWLISIAAVLIISLLWWWPLIRSITRPLARITRTTEKIAAGRFEVSLPVGRRDEIGRLSQAINEMAARLKGLIWGHKHFLASVGHELASPMARIKLGLGILEQELPKQYAGRLQMVAEDAEAMSRQLDELLSFSRAELNPARANMRNLQLLPLAQRAWQRESRGGGDIELETPPGIYVHADADLLLRALCNILRNAVRYAGWAGPITLKASRQAGTVVILVRDQGPGVPETSLSRLFEPFHQTQSGQSRSAGVGMGLSIVKTCIEACKGQVSSRNRPKGGFEVEIRLMAGSAPAES
jgi:two-component system sensor histidine kinase CpxA